MSVELEFKLLALLEFALLLLELLLDPAATAPALTVTPSVSPWRRFLVGGEPDETGDGLSGTFLVWWGQRTWKCQCQEEVYDLFIFSIESPVEEGF